MFTIGKHKRMVDNQVVSRIAQKIRSTRLEKNLTIQELATRTHVSKGLLSKIENSRTIPSLPVFVTLIQSLEISLKEFFQDMVLYNGKNYLLVKKDQYVPLEREDKSGGLNFKFVLSQNITNCTMEIVMLTLESGGKGKSSTTNGYKFNYIVSGSCEYHINNDIFLLDEGDSIYFDATVPHMPLNRSRRKFVALSIHFILPEH
jgi:transcriptional regulator with XRE-family HTH domain